MKTKLNKRVSHKSDFENWVATKEVKVYNSLSEVLQNAPFELKKGQYVTVRNGYGHTIGPFEVLGFCEDPTVDKFGHHIYLDWDCYWYPEKPKNVLTIK